VSTVCEFVRRLKNGGNPQTHSCVMKEEVLLINIKLNALLASTNIFHFLEKKHACITRMNACMWRTKLLTRGSEMKNFSSSSLNYHFREFQDFFLHLNECGRRCAIACTWYLKKFLVFLDNSFLHTFQWFIMCISHKQQHKMLFDA
jgi:hypothetical protein